MGTLDIADLPESDLVADLDAKGYHALLARSIFIYKRYGAPGMSFMDVIMKAKITDQDEMVRLGGVQNVANYLTKNKCNPWNIKRLVLAKTHDDPPQARYFIWFEEGTEEAKIEDHR